VNEIPDRKSWKRDLSPYLEIDRGRSAGQLASVVLPYLAVWGVAVVARPGPWLGVGLGLVATVFLIRMYSLFHDLAHHSLFESRAANARWGHALGFLLFTPYRWWQRQHSLHHANTGNLDRRGPGEIYTMTLAEYVQHQYEDTYFQSAGAWRFELAALEGSSYLRLPRALAWVVGNANYHHVHHLSARIPNYRLRAAHEEQPLFARTPVVTVRGSIAALRPKLWDEELVRLVPFTRRWSGSSG
jgi:fatty acid desaturase